MMIALTAGILIALAWLLLVDRVALHRLRRLLSKETRRRLPARPLSIEDQQTHAVSCIDKASELLRVGMPPASVMKHLGELEEDTELQRVLMRISKSLSLGQSPYTAIERDAQSLKEPVRDVLRGMAAVWFVAETAGAPAADMLARYGKTCREHLDAERERAVALAGPASTVTVLTWLPVISLGLGIVVGARPGEILSSPLAMGSVALGVILLVTGRLWMQSMLKQAR